jgi:hypothetical protein
LLEPEVVPSVYETPILKVPVMLGVPETTPSVVPTKKLGRFSKVKVGALNPLTLKMT